MSTSFKSRALVLSSSPQGEKDRLIDFFTEEEGRTHAVAYGVRKPGSRFGALLEPGMLLDVLFRKGRASFLSVGECSSVRPFPAEMKGLEEMETLLDLLNLVRSGIREGAEDRFLFADTAGLLEWLASHAVPGAVVLLRARVVLLRHSGLLPDWNGCGICDRIGTEMRLTRHGLFCSSCTDTTPLARLMGGDVRVLAWLSGGIEPDMTGLRLQGEQMERIRAALDALIRHARQGT